MFENLFTTKMSMDKEKLRNRFLKIRSENGRVSRLFAFILFAVILLIMAAATVIIALNVTDDRYIMTDEEFEEYGYRPIGSIMAELDYADDERIVFHYLEGFFVVDRQTNEVIHKINLNKLNVAPHTQGEVFLNIAVDKEGRFAYLSSQGKADLVKRFDRYIIDLDTGEVKIGEMPEDTQLVTYAAAMYPEGMIDGWYDTKTFITEDKSYLLTAQEYNIGALQLVIIHNSLEDMIGYRYVFGERFIDNEDKRDALIEEVLANGEEIQINSQIDWTVSGKKALEIHNEFAKTMNMPSIKADPNGDYNVRIYGIWNSNKNESYQKIFIIDNADLKIIFNMELSQERFYAVSKILGTPEPTTELYKKTEAFLEKEFHKVYDPYYDIQGLTISGWTENGNEAMFWYKMSFLNYNRDPDKAEYIQEAKKRSEKEYKTLYKDYLALKEGNYQFKVADNGKELVLYSNQAPKGTDWQPVEIDDYIGGE